MPNISSILKSEIARVARKETKAELAALKKAVALQRREIAALKKRAAASERDVKALLRTAKKSAPPKAKEDSGPKARFSASGLANHRQRLGLSAEAFGSLMGVSGQSIYKWETGKARPRASQLAGIAKVRAMGKREALAALPQE